jgi:dihydroorotase
MNIYLLYRLYDCFGTHAEVVGVFTSNEAAHATFETLPDAKLLESFDEFESEFGPTRYDLYLIEVMQANQLLINPN